MIELAVSEMMMNCVTHGMGFACTVVHRSVFMDDKLIVESPPSEKFNSNLESERTKSFLSQILFH